MKYVVAKCAQLWFKKKTEKYKVTLTQQQQSNVCACANFIKTRGGGEERNFGRIGEGISVVINRL